MKNFSNRLAGWITIGALAASMLSSCAPTSGSPYTSIMPVRGNTATQEAAEKKMEYMDARIVSETGSIPGSSTYQISDSKTYVLVVSTKEGKTYTAQVRTFYDSNTVSLEQLAARLEPGDEITVPLTDEKGEKIFNQDGIGVVFADYIHIKE